MLTRTLRTLTMITGAIALLGFSCESPSPPSGSGAGSGPGANAGPGASSESNWADTIADEAAKRLPGPQVTIDPADDRGEAVFAAGCFWCVEAVFNALRGVESVTSGYTGGKAETANYQDVSSGTTRHAEAVRVRYDPRQVRYDQLLHVFFATHDPTQKNRQGPDVGPQYRSAIFYADEHQQRVGRAYLDYLQSAGAFDRPIVTTLEPLEGFHTAEEYHQDFVERNPRHPYVRMWAMPKLDKLDKHFGEKLRDE